MRGTAILRRLPAVAGYLLYAVLVLGLLLYLRFPGETVRTWMEQRFNTAQSRLQCTIGHLAPTWTGGLQFSDIRFKTTGSDGVSLMKIDSLLLRPRYLRLATGGERIVTFRCRAHGGKATGWIRQRKDASPPELKGDFHDIALESFRGLGSRMKRKFNGSLSGKVTLTGRPGGISDVAGKADITIDNGGIELQRPLFGLGAIDFNSLTSRLKIEGGKVLIVDGKIDSRLFLGLFSGEVHPAGQLRLTSLLIDGTLEPRPELFTGLADKQEVDVIRGQLRDGKLPFSISGTLLEPGITFATGSGG